MIFRITILVFLTVLAACKEEEVFTVEYYLENHIKHARSGGIERKAQCFRHFMTDSWLLC